MKNLLKTLAFALPISILLISCTKIDKETRLHILHFENSQGEKGITTSYYDNSGFNYGAKWELLNGTRWSENYHIYDENGNMTLKYREFSDSLISYTWYTYNQNNQLIKEKFFRSDSVSGLAYYKYDDVGKLILMDCQKFNGWLTGKIHFTYNEKGLKTRGSIKIKGQEIGFIEYKYKEGLLHTEYWEFAQGYNQTFTHEYQTVNKAKRLFYPSSNVYITNVYDYKVTLEEYDYNNQGGGPSYFTYDMDGKLAQKTFVREDGLKTITDFEYDSTGLLKRSIRNYNSGEKGIFNYKFNGNRRLVEKTFSLPKGIEGFERYEYNNKMQLIKAELKNFDTWLTGTITYEYNDDRQLSVGHFKGDKFNAEIYFTFDTNNNVVKYHWNIANGAAAQTYKFTYEKFK